ncbi:hypothetical protein PR048_032044 [Dryococelus australis]|uniref:Uncharacterized protein n=1 Tax=Dryococelus australis TaxID=614101 RepID=A0ABQ9G705_9NEOP|nr:hypothetical protein PR048_032044 [Dryococelus australis]
MGNECNIVKALEESFKVKDLDKPKVILGLNTEINKYPYGNSTPDIPYVIYYLSRFLDKPSNQLWKARKQVLCYLKATQDLKLVYKKTQDGSLHVYSDAGWDSYSTDRKSFSGVSVYFCGNLVSRMSKKQCVVAMNTAEPEYYASALAVKKVKYTRDLGHDACATAVPKGVVIRGPRRAHQAVFRKQWAKFMSGQFLRAL